MGEDAEVTRKRACESMKAMDAEERFVDGGAAQLKFKEYKDQKKFLPELRQTFATRKHRVGAAVTNNRALEELNSMSREFAENAKVTSVFEVG